MISHQARAAIAQSLDDIVGQLLRAIRRVGRAPDDIATGFADHVVKWREVFAQTRQGSGVGGMHVHDGLGRGDSCVEVAVNSPLGGRDPVGQRLTLVIQFHNGVGVDIPRGDCRRADHAPPRGADRHIASGPEVEPLLIEVLKGFRDLPSRAKFVRCHDDAPVRAATLLEPSGSTTAHSDTIALM